MPGFLAAAGIAALAGLCWRFGFADLAAAFERMAPANLVAYLACGCAARLGYSLRWQLVARRLGGSPPLARLLAARLAGDAVGSLLPTGRVSGDPLRVALVYGDDLGGSQASAGVAIDRIMEVIGNTLCVITSVMVFSSAHALGRGPGVAVSLVATMLLLLVLLVIPLYMLRRGVTPLGPLYHLALRYGSPRWHVAVAVLRRTEEHLMRFFREHPFTLVYGLAVSLCIEALLVLEYHFLLASFGAGVDVPTLLMAFVAGGLARAVPMPAGLGTIEASQVTLLAMSAGRADLGFVMGMLLRLHETLWGAVGLMALSLQGFSLARVRLVAARKAAV